MKLYLVQHGTSVSKDVDPGRSLSSQGEQGVRQVAEALRSSGMTVDRILHSSKMRAHQTAEILGEALLISGETEVIDGINPKDSIQDFSLKVHKFNQDTMVVGHLPFMAKMVSYLVTGNEDAAIVDYKFGSVVCLQQNAEEHWQIQWMLRPDTLK
jgi:phosphohistidine phosphatase